MRSTTTLTLLAATASLATAQGPPCDPFPSEFTLSDSLLNTYRISPARNLTSTYLAVSGAPTAASTFFLNPVCAPGFNDVCGVPQLSYNATDCTTGEDTTYGAYAPSDGGDLLFLANGSDVAGLSIVTGSYSGSEFEPGRCERLYLMGFLNKYLSVPRNCAGVLGLDRYFGNSTAGCDRVNVTYAAV